MFMRMKVSAERTFPTGLRCVRCIEPDQDAGGTGFGVTDSVGADDLGIGRDFICSKHELDRQIRLDQARNGYSLAAQRKTLEDYATLHGYEVETLRGLPWPVLRTGWGSFVKS